MAIQSPEQNLNTSHIVNGDENNQYLLFFLGEELYGAPLLQVKEIVKILPTKKVPFMKPYFKGLINLRGQVVSVIDLRMKLSINTKNQNQGLVMIVETNESSIGAIIDDLHSVHHFDKSEININSNANKQDKNTEYLYGVARLDENRLVNLIDMSACIGNEDLKLMSEMKVS